MVEQEVPAVLVLNHAYLKSLPKAGIDHNRRISRLQMAHDRFADRLEVDRLKKQVLRSMEASRATRGVLRVLTDEPQEDGHFKVEAAIKTPEGVIAVFGYNLKTRPSLDFMLGKELLYASGITSRERRPMIAEFGIVRLPATQGIALELAELYSRVYSFYPVSLAPATVLDHLRDSIPYAVLHEGRILSVLFGVIQKYGPVTVVEFTLSATVASSRGVGMTTALAAKIREEAAQRFTYPVMVAETIAAPVMRSCHDLGMEYKGVLRNHYRIGIGERIFTNLHVWSL